MALLKQSVQVYAKLDEFFEKLREGQAPEKFTRSFLQDLGFKSSNWPAAIRLMKGLGFLSSDGAPTASYMEFLDKTRWRVVLGKLVREAYGDIFVMKREPTADDFEMIVGKYKSTYNMTGVAAERAARTFLALLELSDKNALLAESSANESPSEPPPDPHQEQPVTPAMPPSLPPMPPREVGLHYNIQIHLPATKDVGVYNAIFKSLREHIVE